MSGAQAVWLHSAPGQAPRLHLQHGPIDLIIGCQGSAAQMEQAYSQAWARFQGVLSELVAELPQLRAPIGAVPALPRGPVARRMMRACHPYAAEFITPMAAVAGAVADEVLAAMLAGLSLEKAFVNNGGDIALHLDPGQSFRAGLVVREDQPQPVGFAEILAEQPVRGIATSGWRGRSFSRGIADAVTVLATDAARADAAATMIANAVNACHPSIRRQPACELQPDSDLGDIPVTIAVGPLPADVVEQALSAGQRLAHDLCGRGLILAAHIALDGQYRSEAGSAGAGPAIRRMVQ